MHKGLESVSMFGVLPGEWSRHRGAGVSAVLGQRVDDVVSPPAAAAPAELSSKRRARRLLLSNRTATVSLAVLLLIGLIAIAAPLIYPANPQDMVGQAFIWPGQNPDFLFGTDALGRDVAAGLVYGARVSLLVGVVAAGIGVGLGVAAGAVAGYFGGVVEDVLMRLVEVMETLPNFVVLVVLVAIITPSIGVVSLTIGLISWAPMARLVRGEFRSLREKDFVTAARGAGFGHLRIAFREILPNALPPVVVMSSVMAASAILMEAALSFMGLGDPNVISWGTMIGAGREALRTAWYLTAIPGLAIVITVLALNLVGDGLNDALNPRFTRD
ncbi:MAG TPA: ABC transporter permease [Pseudolabrys sp.]|nr:ABC transporter permease [Pseudolabrys sp.]